MVPARGFPATNLMCESEGKTVTISWDNGELYDAIKVYRNGDLIVTLAGDDMDFVELGVPAGIHEYNVIGCIGDNSSSDVTCEVAVVEKPQDVTERAEKRGQRAEYT